MPNEWALTSAAVSTKPQTFEFHVTQRSNLNDAAAQVTTDGRTKTKDRCEADLPVKIECLNIPASVHSRHTTTKVFLQRNVSAKTSIDLERSIKQAKIGSMALKRSCSAPDVTGVASQCQGLNRRRLDLMDNVI
jgi:hypothetical protein